MLWWVWLFMTLAFFAGEILVSNKILFNLGVGAIGAALCSLFTLNLGIQLVIFTLFAGLSTYISCTIGDWERPGSGDLIGKLGVVIQEVLPQERGVVAVGSFRWQCFSKDGSTIGPGALVEVVGKRGSTLTVIHRKK